MFYFASFARQDIAAAVKTMRPLSWESIRKDKFSLTPKGLFDALVTQTQAVLSRWAADATRREARLKAPLQGDDSEAEDCEESEHQSPRPRDRYGLDIDNEFRARKLWTSDRREAHKVVFEVLLDRGGSP